MLCNEVTDSTVAQAQSKCEKMSAMCYSADQPNDAKVASIPLIPLLPVGMFIPTWPLAIAQAYYQHLFSVSIEQRADAFHQ